MLMSGHRPAWKIGVSRWGQGDPDKLIWVKDHFRNFSKLQRHQKDTSHVINSDGFREFYQPALTWTKRFRKGNLREIIRCNELNYQSHVSEYGPPDLMLIEATYPGVLIGKYLSEKYGVPFHVHIRLGGFMFQKMLDDLGSLRKPVLAAISKAKLVTVTSDFHAKEIAKWVPFAKPLHNPVDTKFFKLSDRYDDYALAIGRLEQEKGIDLLVDAMAELEGLKIKVVGDGSQRSTLLKKIKGLKIEGRIELVGEKSRDEVCSLIRNCRFLVLPSRYETFGNVLLEAMACGKPVVATKCGGPEEIVTEAVGLLSGINAEDLKRQVEKMMGSFHQYKPGDIRAYVEDRFSPESWIDKLAATFKAQP